MLDVETKMLQIQANSKAGPQIPITRTLQRCGLNINNKPALPAPLLGDTPGPHNWSKVSWLEIGLRQWPQMGISQPF
jgi:hypothetical protein